jgi:hypothetical protein
MSQVDLSKTFHRRELPEPAIQFSSARGRKIFKAALKEGYMESYFNLAEVYETQGYPSFCGLGSLSMCLNALLIDPERIWSGVWRWFDQSFLDCCDSLHNIKEKGIILSKLACMARCKGANCDVFYASELTVDSFRKIVMGCTSQALPSSKEEKESNTNKKVLIASYNRQTLNQTGSGHFSPIGGYYAEDDLVLILDVARFKLPPHWVPLPLLHEAMKSIDPDSGRERGLMVLSVSNELKKACDEYCSANCPHVEKDCLTESESESVSVSVSQVSESEEKNSLDIGNRVEAASALASLINQHSCDKCNGTGSSTGSSSDGNSNSCCNKLP